MGSLLSEVGDLVTRDVEMADLLNAFLHQFSIVSFTLRPLRSLTFLAEFVKQYPWLKEISIT